MPKIRLSKKHGVNPTMSNCFYCNEPDKILLVGASTRKFKEAGLCSADGEMHHNIGVIDMEPCSKCRSYMDQGIIMISTKDGEKGKNPYRTGGWVVVKERVIDDIVQPEELVNQIKKARFCFISDEAWNKINLPRGAVDDVPIK